MWEIIDRLLLIILSYALFGTDKNATETAIYFFVCLSLSSFLYCAKHNLVTCVFLIIYGCLVIIEPSFLFFAPALILDYKKLTGYYRLGYLTVLPPLFLLPGYPLKMLFTFILFTALSFILFYKTIQTEKFSKELIVTRDSSTELQMVLEEKNRTLIAKQDTEVHLAKLQERNRIAREIHDNVGHLLTRSILQTKAIATISKEEALKEPLAQVSDTLNQAMNNIRSSVHDLHDESIDLESGIRQALSCLSDFQVHFDYDVSAYIPKEYKYALIAIAKETANNMVKHSNGNKATYILREHPALYQFSIEDNGTINKKIDFEKSNQEGIGLQNIRTRVENLKGHMNIKTEKGFHIFITLPKNR